MNILTIEFYFSLAVILLIYWIAPSKYRWMILSAASWYFIITANSKKMIVVTAGMFFCTWLLALLPVRFQLNNRLKRVCVIISIVLNACLLIMLKDSHFFVALGSHAGLTIPEISIGAPLGISYFTLSLIGYSLDVYWGAIPPETNPFKFALFAGYFPLLLTGPIVRYGETSNEILAPKSFNAAKFSDGCERILWGLFKKMVISNRAGIIVDAIYNDTNTYKGLYIWFAMLCFVLQLYTDFSGSIDIILGISQLFGIKLPENFDLPFASKSLSEFWRRWHITLGNWLKDYVLYPLLRSRPFKNLERKTKRKFGKKLGRKIPNWIALFISWFVVGFWHGGSWNYIIGVGWYMWAIIVFSDAMTDVFSKLSQILKINTNTFTWRIFQSVRTTFFYMVGLGMFRCYGGFHQVLHVYRTALRHSTYVPIFTLLRNVGVSSRDISMLFVVIVAISFSGIITIISKMRAYEWLKTQNYLVRLLINWIMVLLIVFSSNLNMTEFLYMQF